MIAIVSAYNDLHALAIQRHVRTTSKVPCHIIETDRIAQNYFLSYSLGDQGMEFDTLRTSEGAYISLGDVELIWLRRPRSGQHFPIPVEEFRVQRLIENDCRGGLSGYLASKFKGIWISDPQATYRASDKMYQLKIAEECGFRIPKTLVSQNKNDIIAFARQFEHGIIAKTIVGAPDVFLTTVKIENPQSLDEESVTAAPAIYQEFIPGTSHLRWNCFGNHSYPAILDSADLDWRPNLNIPMSAYSDTSLHPRIRSTLNALELAMGVIDIKLTPEGEPVWLEVNPQGQFIFLDPLTDLNLIEHFSNYLIGCIEE